MATGGLSCSACGFAAVEKHSLSIHLTASPQCRARRAGSTKDLVCVACSTARRPATFSNLWQLVKHFETGKCPVIRKDKFWRLVQKLLVLDRLKHPENTSRTCITFCTNDLYMLPDQHQSSIESNDPEHTPCEDWSRLRPLDQGPMLSPPLKNISLVGSEFNTYEQSAPTLCNISVSTSDDHWGYPVTRFDTPIPTVEPTADVWCDYSSVDLKRKHSSVWSGSPSEQPMQPMQPMQSMRKLGMPVNAVDTDYLPEGTWDAFRLDHHHDRETNTYRCSRATCGQRFTDPDRFRAHYVTYHPPYDQYKCPGNHGPLRKPTLWQLVQHVETNNDKSNCGSRYRSWYGTWVGAVTGGFVTVAPRAKLTKEPVYVSEDPRGKVLHKPEKVVRKADLKKHIKW